MRKVIRRVIEQKKERDIGERIKSFISDKIQHAAL
jgi:hypothetical protein